jgi:dienelactone hydrolase
VLIIAQYLNNIIMKRKYNYLWIVFIAFVLLTESKAQKTIIFNEGLIVGPCHRYGRQGIYTDEFAYQLYTGTLQKPMEGAILYTDTTGNAIKWKRIKANNDSVFIDESIFGAYLYLTYYSNQEQNALLNITGNSMVFFNGAPHAGDVYESKWLYIPVKVRKGLNELYLRIGAFYDNGVIAKLTFPDKQVALNTQDPTLPFVVIGKENKELLGAVVIINAADKPLKNLVIKSSIEGKELSMNVPAIAGLTSRKVAFKLDASNITKKGNYPCTITILQNGKAVDQKSVNIDAVNQDEKYSGTFISNIDNSVQYYGVCPKTGTDTKEAALFLSVHGAGVEAIGQARAYEPKDWGTLVAPTNRRPRGFNWEDWGRIDALEVLDIAVKKFNPDPRRIYLTGHSMGGHGTWYLGATYPGKWAAIAPCAAYPTLFGYGSADGKIPAKGKNEIENTLLRGSNGSNVFELAQNYNASGIYIHHGDSDKVVSVNYARQMRKVLSDFHKDFSYYEYPGGSHWFSNQSVDWPPLFEYFKWHTIPTDSMVNNIDFSTANPAVSSTYYWVSILQQKEPLNYSRTKLVRSKGQKLITGETENISILGLALTGFSLGDTVAITLDKQTIHQKVVSLNQQLYLYNNGEWNLGAKPEEKQKGTVRNGTFKEPFNHQMVFVYGTAGTPEENAWAYTKACYDAETWYYRGNGAVDIVADKEFNPALYSDRGIIIYGNATTNKAWKALLSGCPIQVSRGNVQFGGKQFNGNNFGAYFIWPRPDSKFASVAVITGTGLSGMNAANANQYFAGGSGFPDYMIFTTDLLKYGVKGIKAAGFYTNDWKIE